MAEIALDAPDFTANLGSSYKIFIAPILRKLLPSKLQSKSRKYLAECLDLLEQDHIDSVLRAQYLSEYDQ